MSENNREELKRKIFIENLKLLNNCELGKKELTDASKWATESNFIALVGSDIDIKNAALRASTKLINDLTKHYLALINTIQEVMLDISSEGFKKTGDNNESRRSQN